MLYLDYLLLHYNIGDAGRIVRQFCQLVQLGDRRGKCDLMVNHRSGASEKSWREAARIAQEGAEFVPGFARTILLVNHGMKLAVEFGAERPLIEHGEVFAVDPVYLLAEF